MGDFTKLAVWRKAHELTLAVYRETAAWPRHERFGLVSQARRASASIPCNIAEGCGRDGDAELARFLRIALGSAAELAYLLILARDLEYVTAPRAEALAAAAAEVRRMLAALARKAVR